MQGHEGSGWGGRPRGAPSATGISTEAYSLYHRYNRHCYPPWVLLLPEEGGEQPRSLIQARVHSLGPRPVKSDPKQNTSHPIEVRYFLDGTVLSHVFFLFLFFFFLETNGYGVGVWEPIETPVLLLVIWSRKNMKCCVTNLYVHCLLYSHRSWHGRSTHVTLKDRSDALLEAVIPPSICCISVIGPGNEPFYSSYSFFFL